MEPLFTKLRIVPSVPNIHSWETPRFVSLEEYTISRVVDRGAWDEEDRVESTRYISQQTIVSWRYSIMFRVMISIRIFLCVPIVITNDWKSNTFKCIRRNMNVCGQYQSLLLMHKTCKERGHVGRMKDIEEGTEETRAWSTSPRTSTNDGTGMDMAWWRVENITPIRAEVSRAKLHADLGQGLGKTVRHRVANKTSRFNNKMLREELSTMEA